MRLLILAAVLTAPCSLTAQQPVPAVPQIVTSATAGVQLKPDRATVLLTVESRDPTVAAAAAETARRQRAVLDTLRALGIAADQMTTAGIQINPEYVLTDKTAPPRVGGYVVRNTVRVEVLKLEETGVILDAALAKGATGVGSLQFSSSHSEEARRQALEHAVEKARLDAEAMARTAGGSLGALIKLTAHSSAEASPSVEFSAWAASAPDAPQTPVEPGELHIQATINARWVFSPRG